MTKIFLILLLVFSDLCLVAEAPVQSVPFKELSVPYPFSQLVSSIITLSHNAQQEAHIGIVLPDSYRKYLSRSERAFHLMGARRVRNNLLPEFEALFDTYATPDTRISDVLSTDLQRSILQFLQRFQAMNRQKDIYFSIIRDKIYIALTQDKNLLEPSLLSSNVRYETVLEFYEDLRIALDLALEVDAMN